MTADDGTVDSPVRRRIIDAHTHGAPASGLPAQTRQTTEVTIDVLGRVSDSFPG
jgi:hypothetical protein